MTKFVTRRDNTKFTTFVYINFLEKCGNYFYFLFTLKENKNR